MEVLQLNDENPFVIIGCNRRCNPRPGTVDARSRLHKPQRVPLRDALTMLSPMSLPRMSGKILKTRERAEKKDEQTFEDERIFGVPNVAKNVRDLVGLDIYRFRFISENIELIGMPKVLCRVNFDTVPIFLRRCREFNIKMRVLPESQTSPLVLETAKVPQNLLKAWTVTKHHW
jgi:hypothetical protein